MTYEYTETTITAVLTERAKELCAKQILDTTAWTSLPDNLQTIISMIDEDTGNAVGYSLRPNNLIFFTRPGRYTITYLKKHD